MAVPVARVGRRDGEVGETGSSTSYERKELKAAD